MNFFKTIWAWFSTISTEMAETRRLQQEAQAKQYRQQQRQAAIAGAAPHYIPFAGGVLFALAAVARQFEGLIQPSRLEDIILPPMSRVALDGSGGLVFRYRAQWRRPLPEVETLGGAKVRLKPGPLIPVDELARRLEDALPACLGPRGYGVRWVRVVEVERDALLVEIGGVHLTDAAAWRGWY